MYKPTLKNRLIVKLTSTKFLITLWACFLLTFIVIKGLSYPVLEPLLAAIPLSYYGVNILEKRILKQD